MSRTGTITARKAANAGIIALCALLLSACLLAPGKFASTLDIRKDGQFNFTYVGELHFISPSEFSDKKDASKNSGDVFEPEPCRAASGGTRECSSAELDRQMRDWADRQKTGGSKPPEQAKQMAAMMGSKDMSDPQTAQAFARSLEKQHGWRRVTYKGEGMFEVDYAITGTLTHDFIFPVMDDFPMANPFVQISLRKDGSARVDAPGYSSGASGGPLKGLATLAAMDTSKKAKDNGPKLPVLDGTFALTTDGRILANNTEEGPQQLPSGNQLQWRIDSLTETAPTALIGLGR